MEVFIIREKKNINAKAEYDPETGMITVLKGSVLSEDIAHSKSFRGARSIERSREGVMKNNILQKDVVFKSTSTAANFVTGSSTNGLTAWKDKSGRSIKQLMGRS